MVPGGGRARELGSEGDGGSAREEHTSQGVVLVATGAFFVSSSQVHPLFASLQQAHSWFRWFMCICRFVAAGVIFARVVAAGVFSFLCRRCSVYFFRRRSLFWHPCRRCFLRVDAAGEVVISIRAAETLSHTSRSQFSESRSRRLYRASRSQ